MNLTWTPTLPMRKLFLNEYNLVQKLGTADGGDGYHNSDGHSDGDAHCGTVTDVPILPPLNTTAIGSVHIYLLERRETVYPPQVVDLYLVFIIKHERGYAC